VNSIEPGAEHPYPNPPPSSGRGTDDDFALAARATPLARFVLDAIDASPRKRITFAAFMALALGHPEHGYYARAGLAWGREGDYETSPEVHPIFGYLWARQLEECWERLGRPSPFAVVEPGAGSGAFAVAYLTWLRARAPECFATVLPVILDGHPRRVEDQRAALAAAGFAAEHALIDDWLVRPDRVTGVMISNEYFDALPVHLVTRQGTADGDALAEWYVARASADANALTLVEGEPSTPALDAYFARLGVRPGDGARAEVNLAAVDAMRALAAKVERGYILTIDYGYLATDLYAPWRREGTLMAFRRHTPQPDPLLEPGRVDLTAHVDFTSLAAAAGDGWDAAPLVSQAEALTVLGLPEALRAAEARASLDAARYVEERRVTETLTDPTGLGRIRVQVVARGAPLEGLRCLRNVEAVYGTR
jgi:SAM-dependent MidA family methyltransferase